VIVSASADKVDGMVIATLFPSTTANVVVASEADAAALFGAQV
jgi:hypothetical protein